MVALPSDVLDTASYSALKAEVEKVTGEAGLNILLNNAAINLKHKTLEEQTRDGLMAHFEVNTVAPLLLTQVCTTYVRHMYK